MSKPSPAAKARLAFTGQRLFATVLFLCLLAYGLNIALSEVSPGGSWGLSYGWAAASFLLLTALYGVRRRFPAFASRRGLGSARAWLGLHLYGGLLFLLLVLMHSGFGLPQGALTWWLWGLSLWTVVSGLAGWGLQRWLPRVLASGLSTEVIYERIPSLVEELREQAAEVAEGCEGPLRSLYSKRLEPALRAPRRKMTYFFDITGGVRSETREIDYLRPLLAKDEKAKLVELERLFRAKLELDAHYTLQRLLRTWIYLHVPLSLVLLALVVLHVVTVVLY